MVTIFKYLYRVIQMIALTKAVKAFLNPLLLFVVSSFLKVIIIFVTIEGLK